MKPLIDEGDFFQEINDAIAERRHVSYLKRVLKDYEDYKKVFATKFTDKNSKDAVYTFRVSYLLKKPVWRDISIRGNQKFIDLADMIIESMGWLNDHMHGFSFPEINSNNSRFYSLRYTFYAPGWEDDPHPTFKSDQIRICDIDYAQTPKLRFMFDFGDGHEFDIELKKIGNVVNPKIDFPVLVDQRGIAPEQYPKYE